MDAEDRLQLSPPPQEWWHPDWERPQLRKRVLLWEAAGRKCHWCGKATRLIDDQLPDQSTIDHVIPRGRGGNDARGNLVSACHQCNARRNTEDMKGLADGALLGKFTPVKHKKSTRFRIALTGDEKKQILEKHGTPVKRDVIEIVKGQRDTALKEIGKLREEQDRLHRVIESQAQKLRSMTIWQVIKRDLLEILKDDR